MSAARRVAHAAETIRARWERRTVESPQVEAAQALEDTGQLLDPEVAAELERLRRYAATRQAREEELLATMGRIDLRKSPDAWALGMTVISHMDGPFSPCTAEELEPGLWALVEQLRGRIAELEAAAYGDAEVRLLAPVEQIRHLHQALAAQLARAGTLDRLLREAQAREAGPALPWAHTMPDDDLHGFLGDLVSAAMGRWRSEPEVPDRTVLADIEKVCADWRTPGAGLRSDPEPEPAPDAVTRVFVPVASLREPEPEPEFHSFLHHENRVSHDLPETGGTR